MSLETGTVVEGVVTGVTDFGAFVKLPGGETGLVHISEVADEYVKDIRSFVAEQDTVTVKVLGLNKKGKYDLSIKQASGGSGESGDKPRPRQQRRPEPQAEPENSDGFEEKLKKWRRESEERLLDVRRNTENKRGGGGRHRNK